MNYLSNKDKPQRSNKDEPQRPEQNHAERVLNIDGVINFRDLGGYQTVTGDQVVWAKVYRSAQLDRLTEKGIEQMVGLGVKTVIDLRFEEETARYPTVRSAFPEARIIAWQDESQGDDFAQKSSDMKFSWRDSLASNDPAKVREAMRVNYPKKLYSHRAIYREMLLSLIDGQAPLVFHCAAGKDRTGVAAALILSLLGVPNDTIIEDYLLTQQEIGKLTNTWLAGGATDNEHYQDFQAKLAKRDPKLVAPIFAADINYIKTLLEYVATHYGSFEQYAISKLELDKAQIEALRKELLNGSKS